MSLITCPDCESTVSSKARSCPSCGHPVEREASKNVVGGLVDSDVRIVKSKWFWAFIAILVVVSFVGGGPMAALGLVLAFLCIAFYFLPTIYATRRKHRSKDAIAVLNLLLGWTFIGWVAAAVWASTDPT